MICELILALVSLWILVNSIKNNPKEKRPIDLFGLFYSKIFFIILLLFCLFWFSTWLRCERSVGFYSNRETDIKKDYKTWLHMLKHLLNHDIAYIV